MRKGMAALCGLCMVGGLLAGTPLPRASAKVGTIDKELLGIRLLQSYKAVLQLYGQPTRIYRADEFVNLIIATDANGRETGGISAIGDGSQSGGGGFPGGGAMPGMGGGRPSGMPGGMPGSGGPMGMPGSGGGAMAMPRVGGKMGGGGGFPGRGAMPGMGGAAMGGASSTSGKAMTFADSGGFTWIYFYPREELAYVFFFNADGRVEMISEHGRYKGKPSSRGIHLGDPAKSIYSTYGWPDTVEQQASAIVLNYNLKHHILFDTLNGKVGAISVFLKESSFPRLFNASGGGGGGGRMPGGGGMMPGSGGGAMRMPGGGRGKEGGGGVD
jgi:hypothetical protein